MYFALRHALVLIPFGSIKENPEGIEPIGILYGNLLIDYGNFIKDEYLLALRLASELADLRAANANP